MGAADIAVSAHPPPVQCDRCRQTERSVGTVPVWEPVLSGCATDQVGKLLNYMVHTFLWIHILYPCTHICLNPQDLEYLIRFSRKQITLDEWQLCLPNIFWAALGDFIKNKEGYFREEDFIVVWGKTSTVWDRKRIYHLATPCLWESLDFDFWSCDILWPLKESFLSLITWHKQI